VQYIDIMPTLLPDAQFAVLGLVAQEGPISGYGLMAIVKDRGMLQWAGLSQTSVYKSLAILGGMRFLAVKRDDRKKAGKGPSRLSWSATRSGRTALRRQVAHCLRYASEQSASFKLALMSIDTVAEQRIAVLVSQRIGGMRKRLALLANSRQAQSQSRVEPRAATLLFDYAQETLEYEVSFLRVLLGTLRGSAYGH
jgi:DNA-binding PadR family transcriptional regulator